MELNEYQQLSIGPNQNQGNTSSPRRSRSGSDYAPTEVEIVSNLNGQSWAEYRPSIAGMDKSFESRYLARTKTPLKATIQGKVYNFLERPTGWKCFIYHFTV